MDARLEIVEAFSALLAKKPFEQITVAEICRAADVSNKTLYKYFEGREDIVRAIVRRDMADPVRALRSLLPIDDIKSATPLLLEKTCTSVYEHRELYKSLLSSMDRATFTSIVTEELYQLNMEVYGLRGLSQIETEFVSHLFASMQTPLIAWWLEGHEDMSPKQVAHYFNVWAFSSWREFDSEKFGDPNRTN